MHSSYLCLMKKVLVVDDDPFILMSVEFLMKKSGYDVMVARNGNEALELINNNKPDLILLDIMMPDVDGYSICNYVKSSKNLKDIVVVFLSAKTEEADIERGYALGASLFVSKPFSTRELVKKIKTLIPD